MYTFKHIGLKTYISGTHTKIDGKTVWVSFLAGSEGAGKARVWYVIASHFNGEAISKKVTAHAHDRNEAANLALQALVA